MIGVICLIIIAICLIPTFFEVLGDFLMVGCGIVWTLIKVLFFVSIVPLVIIGLMSSGILFIAIGIAIIFGIGSLLFDVIL